MNRIKFFSLIMLLSIGLIACKDNSKKEASAEAITMENDIQASKTELVKNITELQETVNTRIIETENQIAGAAEEAKADLKIKLDGLQKQKTDLENLSTKVVVVTAEGWADFQQQATTIVAEVREALSK